MVVLLSGLGLTAFVAPGFVLSSPLSSTWSAPAGTAEPSFTSEAPDTNDADSAAPDDGPGQNGPTIPPPDLDGKGKQTAQAFLDAINAGDAAAATGMLCADSTSQADVTAAVTADADLQLDPVTTQSDASYFGADLTGTLNGQANDAARLSVFLQSGGWCVYSFFAI